jgi:5-methylcytosine-specific restriction endonuclease McrA
VSSPVLVLNENYEPLNVCNEKRAIVLVSCGKAEVLEHGRTFLHSPSQRVQCPSVIRLVYLIKRPRQQARLTRREVFLRDNFTCQYCGSRSRELTLDHVIPRQRGGQHTWENLVSACSACNHRKGNKSVEEARMTLRRSPFQPKATTIYSIAQYLRTNGEWAKFLPATEMVEA